jgi:hypothetical protein
VAATDTRPSRALRSPVGSAYDMELAAVDEMSRFRAVPATGLSV